MKTKALIFFLGVSLALNAFLLARMDSRSSGEARTAGPASSAPCPIANGDRHLYQALGLSQSQLARVEPMARTFHARLEALQSEMTAKKILLVDLLGRERVDPGRVEELRKEMSAIQDGIQRGVIAHILELKNILTPQQGQRFLELLRRNMIGPEGPPSARKGDKG